MRNAQIDQTGGRASLSISTNYQLAEMSPSSRQVSTTVWRPGPGTRGWGGSLQRYLRARSLPRDPVARTCSVTFSPYAALAIAAIRGREARTWSNARSNCIQEGHAIEASLRLRRNCCSRAEKIRHPFAGYPALPPGDQKKYCSASAPLNLVRAIGDPRTVERLCRCRCAAV